MSFQMQGVKLDVEPTDAVVKADRILTLFMINTIADNARKFTPEGGKVTISAKVSDFVEISISDTGKGMDEEQLAHVFDRTYTGGHGFGLLNCKGIIEKYKKVSSLFAGCQIKAESKLGEGSRFSFRLPKGIARRTHQLLSIIMLFVLLSVSVQPCEAKKTNGIRQRHNHLKTNVDANLQRADDFADSAYFSNINRTYQRTLLCRFFAPLSQRVLSIEVSRRQVSHGGSSGGGNGGRTLLDTLRTANQLSRHPGPEKRVCRGCPGVAPMVALPEQQQGLYPAVPRDKCR